MAHEYVFDRKGIRWVISCEDRGLDQETQWCITTLQEGLKTLTQLQRDVMNMRIDGRTYQFIGAQMGFSPQRAHRIMKQAQKALLKQYKKETR